MPRGGGVLTARKQIWLSDEGRQAIQAWADTNHVSFSAAIETLARLGLGQAPEEALAPALVSTLRREIQQQFHRYASLLAALALESGVTTRLAGAALVALRPKQYEAIKRAARIDAVQALRRREALAELATVPEPQGESTRGEAAMPGPTTQGERRSRRPRQEAT